MMSKRTHVQSYQHFVWSTKDRRASLNDEGGRRVAGFLQVYLKEKGVELLTLYVNPDHVHILINMPTNYTLEELVKYFKGSSSYWINKHQISHEKFRWQRSYAVFSVSYDKLPQVCSYIDNQKVHHRNLSFREEFVIMMERAGLKDIAEGDGFIEEDEAPYDFEGAYFEDLETVETVDGVLRDGEVCSY